jgi:hypothetical protein
MRRHSTLTEFAVHYGVHRAHVARTLGIAQDELDLLDRGRADIPDADVPKLVRRIGGGCTERDVQQLLAALRKVPSPYDFVARIGGCSVEWKARRGEGLDPERFLDERFPDALERRQVAGPNSAGNFEWRRVVVRVAT